MDFSFNCLNADCEEELEVEIDITSWGSRGTSGSFYEPPDPGDPPEWTCPSVTCEKCGTENDGDRIAEKYDDLITEKALEARTDMDNAYDEDYYDDMKEDGRGFYD